MKKILALVIALVMCFVIVACDDKKDEGATTTAGTAAGTAADTTAAGTEADTTGSTDAATDSPAGTYTCKAIGSDGMYVDPASMGFNFTIILNADGKGTMDSEDESVNLTWTLDGDKLTLVNTDMDPDDEEAVIEVVYKDGTICMDEDSTETWFVREGASLPSNVVIVDLEDLESALGGEEPDDEEEDITGEYELVAIGSSFEYVKPSDLGMEMTLVLEEDGKGSLSVDGDTDDIEWEFDGMLNVTITDESDDVLEGIYMDGVITFSNVEDASELVFAAEGAELNIEFIEIPAITE